MLDGWVRACTELSWSGEWTDLGNADRREWQVEAGGGGISTWQCMAPGPREAGHACRLRVRRTLTWFGYFVCFHPCTAERSIK